MLSVQVAYCSLPVALGCWAVQYFLRVWGTHMDLGNKCSQQRWVPWPHSMMPSAVWDWWSRKKIEGMCIRETQSLEKRHWEMRGNVKSWISAGKHHSYGTIFLNFTITGCSQHTQVHTQRDPLQATLKPWVFDNILMYGVQAGSCVLRQAKTSNHSLCVSL